MRRVVTVTAALVAAVAVWGLSLPPRRAALVPFDDGTVRGVLHVHSRVSDGRGTADEIATAAARAGLQFVVITDHGDGTRKPEPPSYRSGVLVLDGTEISTRGGHYVAVGMTQSPYPLAGEPADVVDDVRRLGGFGIAAHPDSPKPELRWTDWTAPIDAVELINPDTSWRVHAFTGGLASRFLLLRSLLAYPARPAEAIAQLVTDSERLRQQWMQSTANRAVVAVAGVDAHAKVALRDTDPGDNRYSVPIPAYEASFEALSVHVRPDRPFSAAASADAAALLGGLRAGHAYVAVDGWASPASFEFSAVRGDVVVQAGETVAAGQPLTLRVRSNMPSAYRAIVLNGSTGLTERAEPQFEFPVDGRAGVYRVELVRADASNRPAWLTSNPIYVRDAQPPASATLTADRVAPVVVQPLFDGRTTAGWSYENDRTSLAQVDVAPLEVGNRIRLRYGLSGGAAIGQYAAAAVATGHGVEGADAVSFSVRSESPMRISVQVRVEVAGAPPERFERSVYVTADEQERTVRFDQMTPVGTTHAAHPVARDVRAIMFVVDTTNTKPGASGRLWLGNVRLVRDAPAERAQVRTVSTR